MVNLFEYRELIIQVEFIMNNFMPEYTRVYYLSNIYKHIAFQSIWVFSDKFPTIWDLIFGFGEKDLTLA